ncbi:GATA transcription factor 29 [Eutrema salsugineum]|uniref:GATA transcription factor 29 n=1 Tax=Eutrema salsugineum TaxID=72664 RepID=UPI000CED53BD|nr:GATA transcription factor 29 [Eutrema salsugineum]
MENELDLTLRLGLPSPVVETELSLNTSSTNQGIIVNGGRRENNNDGGEIYRRRRILREEDNANVHIRYYNLIFNHFAGIGETLNFNPYPMPQSPSSSSVPAPASSTGSDYVLIDVPARRARRNNSLVIENALDANADVKRRRGCGGGCGGRIDGTRKCTNMNCNAVTTPMWRRGPLGPKTLCNACGIKFRKEEERKSKRN